MNDLFPLVLGCGVFALIVGMAIGLFVATAIYSKQNKTVQRLKNINNVAQNWFDGNYAYEDGKLAALSFILCESDLNIRKKKEKKNECK